MARRRSNNTGSIYRRSSDGRWVAAVTIDGRRKYKYGKTQRKCREWLSEILKEIDRGLTFEATKISLTEYLQHWLDVIKPSIRIKTWIQYEQIVRNYLLPSLGTMRLWDIKPGHIQKFYSRLRDSGTSPHMLRHTHSVLHSALNKAVKWGIIGRNPASAVDKPQVPKKEMQTLDRDQVRLLLQSALGTKYEGLYFVAVSTGAREGEVLAWRWSDIDWNSSTLTIQRQVQWIPRQGLVFSEPKSKSSIRSVKLGPAVIDKLLEHRKLQQAERLFVGERWQDLDLIFTSQIGTPIAPRNLLRVFKKHLRQVGLPEFRFHDLRHTSAKLLLEAGIQPIVVSRRLGHSSVSFTMDVYGHVTPGMQEKAAQLVDELIVGIPVSFSE